MKKAFQVSKEVSEILNLCGSHQRGVYTKRNNFKDNYNDNDVSIHTDDRHRSVNSGAKHVLRAPAVSTA